MNINVKEFLGENFLVEDAIILRDYIKNNLSDDIELDFCGVEKISTNFLTCLFTELINTLGRDSIIKKINVKNLSNYRDYYRVVKGTTFN